jgi:predicted HTH domain antitoxin
MAVEMLSLPRPHEVEDLEKLKEQAYQEGVLDLVRQGKISSGYGAQLLKMSKVDFLELMKARGIPIFPYQSAEELKAEIEDAAQVFSPDNRGC